jgi:FkbM family methyltransferase
MTTLSDLRRLNEAALSHRELQERSGSNELKQASLKELMALPPYIGFVEANFLADLHFLMFLNDRDDGIALRLLWKREFEPVSLAIWRRLVSDADLIVDVGGHTGIYSIVAGLSNRKAAVHTFEPHEINFGRLLLNLRANGLTGNNSHNLAASRSAGAVPFQVKINHYMSAGGSVVAGDEEFAKMVQAGPIDDHIPAASGHACVKIDTEGHELEVMAGMPNLLKRRPDIILECAFAPLMRDLEAELASAGYRFFFIDEKGWELDRVESLSSPPSKIGPTERENVLLTTRSETEVRSLFDLARRDYDDARVGHLTAAQLV